MSDSNNESSNHPSIPADDAPMLEWALFYAVIGWPVVPLHEPRFAGDRPCSCGNTTCGSPGKHPRLKDWPTRASTDPETIKSWWTKYPTANIGVVTGSRSGIGVLDIDPRNGGDLSFDAMVREHGALPQTAEDQTGGGGQHLIFRCPEGVVLQNRAGILPGIDFKGENGFIVVAPSLHKSGRRYGWEASSQPGTVEVATMPPWLLKLVTAKPEPSRAPEEAGEPAAGGIPAGARNATLTSLAGTMRRRGMSEDAILAALREENRRCIDEKGDAAPLDDSEIRRIAASVARYAPEDVASGASAEAAAKVCADYKARVEGGADAKLAFDLTCLRAAAGLRKHDPRAFAGMCELMRAKKQLTEWRRAVDEADRKLARERHAVAIPSSLPSIIVNDVQLRETVADTTKAIHVANEKRQTLFVRDHVLVRLVPREVGAIIVVVTVIALYELLTKIANWFTVDSHGDLRGVKPERDVASILVEVPPSDLPPLQTVLSAPIFEVDGTLINAFGYDREHAVYFDPTNAIVVDAPTTVPTDEDVRAAVSLFIDDLLVDFPFETDADRAMAIGAFVVPFVRRMVDGCVPIHLFEAPTPGSGKTLIAKLISLVLTGQQAEIGVLPTEEAETRKKITAVLASSPQLVVLDNAPQRKMLDSPVLAAAATSETWTDRILGVSKNITVRNQALWVLTANNPRLSMELARRCTRIRVTPMTDRPWERKEFKHPQIELWTKQHRTELIRAIVVLVLNWIGKGRPAGTESLGSFENWAAVIGGILEAAEVQGFLKNQHQLYENADAETEVWRDVTKAWFGQFGEQPQTVKSLLQMCSEKDLLNEVLGEGTERSRATRLGKQLKAQRGRIYGNLRIDLVQDSAKVGRTYRVVAIEGGRPGSGSGRDGEGTAAAVAAGTHEGDVGDVAQDVPGQRPSTQVVAPVTHAPDAGTLGTFTSTPAHAEKKETTPGSGSFLFQDDATGGEDVPDVPDVPASTANPVVEWTSDGGRAADSGPDDVPAASRKVPRCERHAPRHCIVCGCPDFVESADGRLVCADCPRGPVSGAGT